ncbi:MAG TPA: CNNM domain-containing protein [Burkholderiales bacterium]|nr:CNNM domain-containing protein [Burkholderiales bacterium]
MDVLIVISLILLNGFFAMSEVALLTARRSKLDTLASGGDALAAAAVKLSTDPTRFLSTIQIGITSIGLLNGIFGEAVFAAPLSAWFQSRGFESHLSNIAATTLIVVSITYVSIVVGELVPKRLGQHNAESIARLVAWPMRILAMISAPFVHLLAKSTHAILNPLLHLLRIQTQENGPQALSAEELRTIVLESSNILPKKHGAILLNLFELQVITVNDVMVPRNQIEAINLSTPLEEIMLQLTTSHHRRVIAYMGHLDEIVGTIRIRHALNLLHRDELTHESLRKLVRDPFFVLSGTPLFTQLQNFQEGQDRLGLIVDEYGELQGLVTLEDILEEIIGEFTTNSPMRAGGYTKQDDGSYLIEGSTPLRELNRKLGFQFPLDGPKTLNGLLLEHLQDIPEPNTSLKIAGVPLEIVHTQGRIVKVVRAAPPNLQQVENNNTLGA